MRLSGLVRLMVLVALLPFLVLGLLVLAVRLHGWVRYDPAYFSPAFAEQYATPAEVARSLETALQQSDQAKLAEIQGLRWPAKLRTGPRMVFVMLWDRTDRYTTYLYFDWQTYERYLLPCEHVDGRWVAAPPDLYYYLRSGRWREVFVPAALGWWAVGSAAIGTVLLCRTSARFRDWVCGEDRPR